MGKKLFVGGLSWNTTSEQLKAAFAAVGPVADAVVITDRETGRSRGFGFVTYQNDGDAEKALADLSGTMLDGRAIKVDAATERVPGAGGGPRGPGGPPPRREGAGYTGGGGPPRPGGGYGGGGGPPGGGGGGFSGGGGGRTGGGGGGGRGGGRPDRDRRDREGQRSKKREDDVPKGADYLDEEY
jgi:cold-inducible RNA-binding protein